MLEPACILYWYLARNKTIKQKTKQKKRTYNFCARNQHVKNIETSSFCSSAFLYVPDKLLVLVRNKKCYFMTANYIT